MSRPIARYAPSRRYLSLTLFALGGAVFSAWMGLRWSPSWIAAGLFGISAILLCAVTLRPVIEIHETFLAIGRRAVPWNEIRRVDRTGWNAPLAVYLTTIDDLRILVLYPGDLESCGSLLRHLRRHSRLALLDGVPHRQFWGDAAAENKPSADAIESGPARYPMLRPEDEEEVERLFQKLKSVGRLDARNDAHKGDEK